jgi:uncharacterized membrane protein
MNRNSIALAAGFAFLASAASAEVTFEYLFDGAWAEDLSDDGSVVVGKILGTDEAFRWTSATGLAPLGMSSGAVLGRSAGTVTVSADGQAVAATILGVDSTYVTQGVWTDQARWTETMPPPPPDGGIIDQAYGSCWGISGDGQRVFGLYWRPGASDGGAHASMWTAATGTVDLGSSGGTSRAERASFDGSVVVGWDAWSTGSWKAAAWVNGTLHELSPTGDIPGQARSVNPAGTIVGGYQWDSGHNMQTAAVWRWNGSGFDDTELLGVLPGTSPNVGRATVRGINADGSVLVGYNTYAGDPFYTDGFLWTEATGLVNVVDFLSDHGIDVTGFDIRDLQAVTPDGTRIVGYGYGTAAPFTLRSFMITLDGAVDAPVTAQAPVPTLRAWPNPTPGAASFSFDLRRRGPVLLTIHDISGRVVRRLPAGELQPGRHELAWDGRDEGGARVATGVYYTRLETGDVRETGRITVVR